MPEPGKFMFGFEDMPEWRKYVRFPDLDEFDWRAYVPTQLAPFGTPIDRDTYAIGFAIGNGPYERIASFMGFEDALLALAEFPDETRELVNAIVDWKIEQVRHVMKWIAPDVITNLDDFCTQSAPFMSPEVYRDVFLEANTRYYQAIWDAGAIPMQHTCGYAQPLVELMIESGCAGWSSVQPCNDITALLGAYGDRFAFVGGFDSVGAPSLPDATDETITAEVERCFTTWGKRRGYMFQGFRMANSFDRDVAARERARVMDPALACQRREMGLP